jgi:hypothetical protein
MLRYIMPGFAQQDFFFSLVPARGMNEWTSSRDLPCTCSRSLRRSLYKIAQSASVGLLVLPGLGREGFEHYMDAQAFNT